MASLLVVLVACSPSGLAVAQPALEKAGGHEYSFLLRGTGGFTVDGKNFSHFEFNIVCRTEGDCTGSEIILGRVGIQVGTAAYSASGGQSRISVESESLKCDVFDLGPANAGERVVFDCLQPYGSGISADAVLIQPGLH
ncbi:MAG: hypothetical protein KGI33_05180 [Thaumarchaeota archaeon]|nr:hypothetical protein [Nitrososphaerota archaeon]